MIRNRGFTLLEILLSLTIIAVLGLVFIATTQKIQERNQIRIAASQMNAITNAAIDYYKMYQEWPTTVPTLSPLLGQNLSCSVWKNASGCTTYKITSTANSHYFALAVTPPNKTIAANLVTQLPSAYQSDTTTTVTAYATTFSGFKVQAQTPPPGVLLSANSKQLNGVCNLTSDRTYTDPFSNCFSSASPSPQPYGLIDINTQPKNTIVSQNLFASLRTNMYTATASIGNTPLTCPAGTTKTMIVLPLGVRTVVASTSGVLRYINTYFQPTLYVSFWTFVGNSGSQSKIYNVAAASGDMLCLPATGIENGWGS